MNPANPTIKWFTDYPIRTAALFSLLFGVFTAIPKLSAQVQSTNKASQIRLDAQSKARVDEAENDGKLKLLQVRARLAESRYQQGCLFVSDPGNPDLLTTIEEGKPVGQAGSTTKATIPDGSIACDINGNTGVVLEGVVTDVAFTGNTSIVQAAYQRLISPAKSTGDINKDGDQK